MPNAIPGGGGWSPEAFDARPPTRGAVQAAGPAQSAICFWSPSRPRTRKEPLRSSPPGTSVLIRQDRPIVAPVYRSDRAISSTSNSTVVPFPATLGGGRRRPQLSQDNHAVTAVQRGGGVLRLGAPDDATREQGGRVAPLPEHGVELPVVRRDGEAGDGGSCCGVTQFGFGCQVPDRLRLCDGPWLPALCLGRPVGLQVAPWRSWCAAKTGRAPGSRAPDAVRRRCWSPRSRRSRLGLGQRRRTCLRADTDPRHLARRRGRWLRCSVRGRRRAVARAAIRRDAWVDG